jgi:hypothetical protein
MIQEVADSNALYSGNLIRFSRFRGYELLKLGRLKDIKMLHGARPCNDQHQ